MKKQIIYLAIISLAFFACSKSDDSTGTPNTSAESNTAFYVDTFRIYSTDLKGGNRKLVLDEDLKSQNNYITNLTYLPVANKLIYGYSTSFNLPVQIKSSNIDGTDKKVIKTLATGLSLGFIKGTSDGQIFYQTNQYTGSTVSTKTYSIKADGTGETELQGFLYLNNIRQEQISTEGKGILNKDGYFAKIVNGVFDERNSFNLFLNEDKPKINFPIVSADGSKAAFVSSTSTTRKYEIKIKDAVKDAATSNVLYTITLPTDVNDIAPKITFVNGNKSILVYYGKLTFPKGAMTDYTQCELIDVATGTATNWKFTGDEITTLVTN